MSVRKVVTRSGGHTRGLMPSLKNNGSTAWESQWELKFYQFLDLSPVVRTYTIQPTREQIWVEGSACAYIPDVKVDLVNGQSIYFEVKPALKCRTAKVAKRLPAIQARFDETGRRFGLVTDEWLSAAPRATNVTELMYHRRAVLLPVVEKMRLVRLISAQRPQTLSDLISLIGRSNAWLMLGLGVVGVDLELALHEGSGIFIEGGHRHANIFA